jgi:6,7-dimethyl-8-ribityllumazine synthase
MAKFLQASVSPETLRIAIAVARFNADITEALLDGALQTLTEAGVPPEHIEVARVPGAFELPLICRCYARSGRFDAVLALGCIIRGQTPHFDFVAGEAARGCMQTALDTGIPVVFGVLTTDDLAQAQVRSDREMLRSSNSQSAQRSEKQTPRSNKGAEAALVALEMTTLLEQIR